MSQPIIKTNDITDDAITTAKILNAAVDSNKLATDSVINSKIANDAVNTAEIINDAVTTPKIINDAVTTAKILDNNVTDAKINSVAGSKVTGTVANATTATTANAIGTSNSVGWNSLTHSYHPNLLRNGGFDEDTANPPTGWTDVSGGAYTISTTGDGASPAYLTSRPQIGVGRSRKFTYVSGAGIQYVLRQEIDMFANGMNHAANATFNVFGLFATAHFRPDILSGVITGALRITVYQNGSPTTVSTTTIQNDYRPWRLLNTYAEATGPTNPALTSLVYRIELGIQSGDGYFDSVSAFPNLLNGAGF